MFGFTNRSVTSSTMKSISQLSTVPASQKNWTKSSQLSIVYVSEPSAAQNLESNQPAIDSSSEPEELDKVAKSSQLSLVCVSEPTVIEQESHQQSKTTPMGKSRVSVLDISPYPHAVRNSSIKRRAECSCILTSTPVKRALEEKRSTGRPKKAGTSKKRLQMQENSNAKNEKQQRSAKKPTESTRHGPDARQKKQDNSQAKRRAKRETKGQNKLYQCIYCREPYTDPPEETWIQCTVCMEWSQESCASIEPDDAHFVCDYCA